jgi:hypothetical protein
MHVTEGHVIMDFPMRKEVTNRQGEPGLISGKRQRAGFSPILSTGDMSGVQSEFGVFAH